jgi:FkbM family methyltransferase
MYSQNNEDSIIFSHIPENYIGTILDIGANDGETYSNSRMFIEHYNWNGVLVEPSSKCIQLLNNLYSTNTRVQIIPYAVDLNNGEKTLYVGNIQDTPTSTCLVSTLKINEKEYWEKNRGVKYKQEIIKSITVQELLKLSNYKYFDIISIDVEGLDFEILENLNINNLKPKFIVIEHNNIFEIELKINNILNDMYLPIFKNTINTIFKLKEDYENINSMS